MNSIIAIELGTNAVRIFAFDFTGNIIGFAKGHYPTFHEGPDNSEQDPEQVFITMLYVLKNLLNDTLYPQKYVVGCICFSSSMHSLLTVDKDGVPLGNVITWADNRGKETAAGLRNNDPERFRNTSKFLPVKSYMIQQLTGKCVIDYSIASATGLMNIHKLAWDETAL